MSPTATAPPKGDAARKAKSRAAERDILIPRPADPERRRRALDSLPVFLATYAGHVFWQAMTDDRERMQGAILHAARYGGDQAIAGPRGDGKTTLALWTSFFLTLRGELAFPLIVQKSGPRAKVELRKFQDELESNELLLADFPELCVPIRALEGWASKAKMQTVGGKRTRMEWAADHMILPTIGTQTLRDSCGWAEDDGESVVHGQVIACIGIEGGVRGMNYRNIRPDLAIFDDVDDRESANSEVQTRFRQQVIDEDVIGLAGPGKRIARVMLCTLINHRCAAAIYTDRKLKPSWRGQRLRLLVEKPERQDLWEQYLHLRQNRDPEKDPDAREAHRFYLANRAEMDRGAVVSNPNRYVATPADDGEPMEASALQHCYNLIADIGEESFNTEYQNDPPVEEGPEDSGITASMIQRKVSGHPRGVVPDEVEVLTIGIDIGKRAAHWVAIGWAGTASAWVVAYDVIEIHAPTTTADEEEDARGIEEAIRVALHGFREDLLAEPFRKPDGSEVRPSIVCIDAGYRKDAIYTFVREAGGKPWRAAMGFGSGTNQPGWRGSGKRSDTRVPGHEWFASRQDVGVWLHCLHADYWKRFLHDRLLTPIGGAGCMMVWGDETDIRRHHAFARHLTAEVEETEWKQGKGEKTVWKRVRKNNHWLDAAYMACAAADMAGVKLAQRGRVKREADEPTDANAQRRPQPQGPRRRTPVRRGWATGYRGRY